MLSKSFILKNTVLFIRFFFTENENLYKTVYYSQCNILTFKGSEGKTKLNLGFIWGLRPLVFQYEKFFQNTASSTVL